MRLLPAHYVKPYVGRSKTDRADAAALIEAARSSQIREVPIKTLEQQQLQSLHRLRSQWLSTRQRYLATLRGILREFGIMIPLGASVAKAQIGAGACASGLGHSAGPAAGARRDAAGDRTRSRRRS